MIGRHVDEPEIKKASNTDKALARLIKPGQSELQRILQERLSRLRLALSRFMTRVSSKSQNPAGCLHRLATVTKRNC